ncbi:MULTISPECIES: hypothetical protein [Streptomyces]|uniref:Uncharacterized protein n=1 Tax=Streptomyces heliomycini TaxID=284032 RepID=A0ABV5L9F6_9ACTN|nr:hypothetical protein [Streptomyces sp. XY152]KOV23564.1 hypothetical protein ADK58_23840 [Streptomyces sp. XY152]
MPDAWGDRLGRFDMALGAVNGTAYGTAHGDPEPVERDRRALARLRAEHNSPHSSTGEAP